MTAQVQGIQSHQHFTQRGIVQHSIQNAMPALYGVSAQLYIVLPDGDIPLQNFPQQSIEFRPNMMAKL